MQEILYHDVVGTPFGYLKAGVLPSMKTKDKPHQPWVCLDKSPHIYCAHCTCLAGYVLLCIINV